MRPAARVLLALALVAAVLAAGVGGGGGTASAAGGEVGDYLARINSLRASAGVAPLQLDGQLSSLAQSWANQLAAQGALAHASDLSIGVTQSWDKLGENVGRGTDTATIFNAFVNSPTHRANLVDPSFTRIGIGVLWSNGTQYTVQRFLSPGGPPPTEAPPPPPPPTTAPAAIVSTTPDPPAAGDAPGGGTTPVSAPAMGPGDPDRAAAVLDALRPLDD